MREDDKASKRIYTKYKVSNECRLAIQQVQAASKRNASAPQGCDRICDSLPATPPGSPTFAQRLSPQCTAYFASVRTKSAAQLGKQRGHEQGVHKSKQCAAYGAGSRGSNPVVVQRAGAVPFVLGVVPKSGSTNVHRLQLALVAHHPYEKAPPRRSRMRLSMHIVHHSVYPTVWHYTQPPGVLEVGRLPSFLVSRNPYQRLVSCYLVRGCTAAELGRSCR